MNNNLFETVTRNKLRFATARGQLSVEEVWDLNLNSLDALAKAANKEVKATEEESFIPSARKRRNTDAETRLEILKYIIGVKVDEEASAKIRSEKREKAARLRELIANQQDKELASKSAEELKKMLAEMGEE